MRRSRCVDHLLGHECRPADELRPIVRRSGHLGHEHVELAFEIGEEGVELAARRALGPGQPQRGLGLVDRAVDLHDRRVLGHPSAIEEAGGAVVPRLRVDPRLGSPGRH